MEVLIYGEIYSESAINFIKEVDAVDDGTLKVRVNTPGGNPEYGWGMIAKFQEFDGEKSVVNDGKAHSMGMFFNCYTENASALDVTQFLIHRAAYPEWIEESSRFTDELKGNLIDINKSLEKAFRNKIDVDAFEELKGVKVKDIFSMESRIDVFITAQEAKKIGLINKIIKITPEKKAQIESKMFEVAAKYIAKPTSDANNKEVVLTKTKNEKMTFEELKAKHPELFAQAVATGVANEKDRAKAWLVFNDVDSKAVKVGIDSGENLTQSAMAEFSLKAMSAKQINEITEEGTKTVPTTQVKETVELTEIQTIEASLDVELGLNDKK